MEISPKLKTTTIKVMKAQGVSGIPKEHQYAVFMAFYREVKLRLVLIAKLAELGEEPRFEENTTDHIIWEDYKDRIRKYIA